MPKDTTTGAPRTAARAAAKAVKPVPSKHDEEAIIDIKLRDLRGDLASQISKDTGVSSTSVNRFLNKHKPDSRQSEAARAAQLEQHERLLAIAKARFAVEKKGTTSSRRVSSSKAAASNGGAVASSSKAVSKPVPAAQRVATSGSTSRGSPYASKARPTPARRASRSSAPAADSPANAESLRKSTRTKAAAEELKPSSSKSRGLPYAKPASKTEAKEVKVAPKGKGKGKAVDKPASTSSSSSRPIPVVEIIKRRRSSVPSTSASVKPFDLTSPDRRPLPSGSRGMIVPKSSGYVPRNSTATADESVPVPEGLEASLPPPDESPRKKGKQRAISPAPTANSTQDEVSEAIVEEALAGSQPAAVEPAVEGGERSAEVPFGEEERGSSPVVEASSVGAEGESQEVDVVMDDAPTRDADALSESPLEEEEEELSLPAESSIEEVAEVLEEKIEEDDTLGDLEDGEEDSDAVSNMLVSATALESEVDPSASDVDVEAVIADVLAVVEPSEDYVPNVDAAMEEAMEDLVESAPATEEQALPVDNAAEAAVGEGLREELPVEEVKEGDVELSIEAPSAEGGDVEMALEVEEIAPLTAEAIEEASLAVAEAVIEGVAELLEEPAPIAVESKSPEWPIAYPLSIGQEHVTAAASRPEPYSTAFGRWIWPVVSIPASTA